MAIERFNTKTECVKRISQTGAVMFQEDINKKSAKEFLAASYKEIYDAIREKEFFNACFYESYDKNQPVKVFIDYDGKGLEPSTAQKHISMIIEAFMNDLDCTREDVCLLSACNETKQSYHIIFNRFVRNVGILKNVVKSILEKNKLSGLLNNKYVDSVVYSPRCMRLLLCTKYGENRPLRLVPIDADGALQFTALTPLADVSYSTFLDSCLTYTQNSIEFDGELLLRGNANETSLARIANPRAIAVGGGVDGVTDDEDDVPDMMSLSEVCEKLLNELDPTRGNDRNKWLNIAYILRSVFRKDVNVGYHLFLKFSRKTFRDRASFSRLEFESYVKKQYYSIIDDRVYTVNDLKYLVLCDNPEAAQEISEEIVMFNVRRLSPYDVEISRFIHSVLGHKYVCIDPQNHNWLYFDGVLWRPDPKNVMMRREIVNVVRKVVTCFMRDNKKEFDADRIEVYRRVIAVLSSGKITNSLDSEFYVENATKLFDARHMLMGFNNGTFDFETMSFREAVPVDYITMTTGYDFVEKQCIPHEDFADIRNLLAKIFPDPELRTYVMTNLALSLIPSIRMEHFNIWSGKHATGGNGKSTINDFMLAALGDYATNCPVTLLTQRANGAETASPMRAMLMNKRIVFCQEPSSTDVLHMEIIKELTGGDTIQARRLYHEPVSFRPTFKLYLSCNKLPPISDFDGGSIRRLRAVNFTSCFVEDPNNIPDGIETSALNVFKADTQLKERIPKLKMAFFHTLLSYLQAYKETGVLNVPECVKTSTIKYSTDNNIVLTFKNENMRPCSRISECITREELRARYINDSTLKELMKTFENFRQRLECQVNSEFVVSGRAKIPRLKGWAWKIVETDYGTDDE